MKPVIAWLCDKRGWAYEARVNQLIPLMQDWEHRKVFCVGSSIEAIRQAIEGADVVVCLYVRYMELLDGLQNAVVFLGGMRPFETDRADRVELREREELVVG
jgi:hypothetical protein